MSDPYPYYSPLADPQWQGEMPAPTAVGDQDIGASNLKSNADHAHSFSTGEWKNMQVLPPWSCPGGNTRIGQYSRIGTSVYIRGFFTCTPNTAGPSNIAQIPIDFAPRQNMRETFFAYSPLSMVQMDVQPSGILQMSYSAGVAVASVLIGTYVYDLN